MLKYFMLKRTPLFEQHLALSAKLVPFAGWEMPVSYPAGILAEHQVVRTDVGIFDVGHMGLIKIEGDGALALIQSKATNDASKLTVNECQYSVLCNDQGGVVDDILLYRLPAYYLIVANAINYDKVLSWLGKAALPYENYCLLSVQGPKSKSLVAKILDVKLDDLKKNHALWWRDIIISRTGYTGEDGFELIVAKTEVAKTWQRFIAAKVQPCGLGARDTLRLEAGLPLYGHEYDEETTPLEAGYGWAVKFDKGDFIGRTALLSGPKKKLVGLLPEGRAIPRQGDRVLPAGRVTSGTFSPTLKRPIALAYVPPNAAAAEVAIRGQKVPAKIVAKTFYKR
jgi:aminomethyltransferase